MKKYIVAMSLLLFLSACGKVNGTSSQQPEEVPVQTSLPQLEATEWQTLSTDAVAFNLTGSFDNPNFAYVFDHMDTVPLDQLVAFSLVADAASEGAHDELRGRFLEAPNTVLTYLVLLRDQVTELSGWEPTLTAELICGFIATADASWHDGSAEFVSTMAGCRKNYPEGRIAELLDIMDEEHAASMERNHSNP